jgi:membrane associated rhomboid family serine protease
MVALNIVVFMWEINAPSIDVFIRIMDDFNFKWSNFVAHPLQEFPTLITSAFLHGNRSHIKGNLLFFLLFAPSVEAVMGSLWFFVSYLCWGILSNLVEGLFSPFSGGIGASGAISGVMGAFFVLYPLRMPAEFLGMFRGKGPFNFLGIVLKAVGSVPVFIYIGVYFAFQFYYGFRSLLPREVAGPLPLIGFWAHIGGFTAGALWMIPYVVGKQRPSEQRN